MSPSFHHVCLPCHHCAQRPPHQGSELVKCGRCGAEMIGVGKDFAAPKRRDEAGWKKLQWMIANGWRGGTWPVAPAMNLRAVRESLRENGEANAAREKRVTEEISFEQAQSTARRNARNRQKAIIRKNARGELEAQERYQEAALARAKMRDSE